MVAGFRTHRMRIDISADLIKRSAMRVRYFVRSLGLIALITLLAGCGGHPPRSAPGIARKARLRAALSVPARTA